MKLVSAIMPTRGRREFAQMALECFLQQDYEPKELIVIDDADDPSFPDGIEISGVKYIRNSERLTIAAKRNQAVENSSGEIICHIDSDDYSAPTRISDQVNRLEAANAMLTGYTSMLWWDGEKAFVRKGDGREMLGTSLMYRREQWQKTPFRESKDNQGLKYGEDNRFRADVAKSKAVIERAEGLGMMVARIHPGNTSPKQTDRPQYRELDIAALPEGFTRWSCPSL